MISDTGVRLLKERDFCQKHRSPGSLEKGAPASDGVCFLAQGLLACGELLTSELAQGEASMVFLPSRVSSGKAALERGPRVEKAQLGLGMAGDGVRGKDEDDLCCVWALA